MITRYGMSEDFDMVAMETVTNQYLGGDTSLACSAETQSKIDAQVVELVRKQHEKALTILKDNRGKLDEQASYLYEHETNLHLPKVFPVSHAARAYHKQIT